MELTFLGTNSLLIRKSGSTIFVDPHFTRPGLRDLFSKISPNPQLIARELKRDGVDHLDGVLLTHTHYDHALDAAEVVRQVGGALYGCGSAMNLVNHPGFEYQPCVQVTPGTAYHVGAFNVVFHPACHLPFPAPMKWLMPMDGQIKQPLETPAWFWQYQSGKISAIQIERTLIFGSAGYQPGAYQNLNIENVVLGIGGLDLMPKSYLERFFREAVLLSGATNVYLSHWDNFFKPTTRGLSSHFLVNRAISHIKTLGTQHGQSVELLQYRKPIV